MKHLYTILLLLLATTITNAQKTSVINAQASCTVTLDELKAANFSTKENTANFIFSIIAKKEISQTSTLGLWSTDADYRLLEKSAIIVLRHDYDAARLNPDVKKLGDLQTDINEYTGKVNTPLAITENELVLKAELNVLTDAEFTKLVADNALFTTEETATLKKISFKKMSAAGKANFVELLKERNAKRKAAETEKYNTELALNKTILAKKKDEYNAIAAAIIESKDVISTILHKEDGEWSDYLLNTKNILVVVLGGADDIAKCTIDVQNNNSEFKTSFNELKDLASQLKIIAMGNESPKIVCNVFQINPSKIKPPSTIVIKQAAIKDSLAYKIHESGSLSFKVGISATYVEKNNFKIENGQLAVNLNDDAKKQWKENLFAMVQFSFAARDYDRFGSIFDKKDEVPFAQRFGLFAGCKLSTSPWQLLVGGAALSISRTIAVNVGVSMSLKEADQVKTIGDITSLDEARKLADMEYSNPRFFVGISFSPRIITKALGLAK